jgi:hypothetical protein
MPLQATSGAASYDAFGGGVPVVPTYIEDVMSTWLYTGTGATQTITNGIDLSTKGGLTWIKRRNGANNNVLFDTSRGAGNVIASDSTTAQFSDSVSLTAFNTTGFALGDDSANGNVNFSGSTYVSWTFRKQPKFFDVVTYTGTGSARTIAHSLGSVPGCIIVKRTNTTSNWRVYHRSLTSAAYMVELNTSAGQAVENGAWNSTAPTSSVFTVGSASEVNASGSTYVAYVFAHDAGGFGLLGTDNVISCGSFTTNGSRVASVNLGYEPQWVVAKAVAGGTGSWVMQDNMRGFTASPTVFTANPLLFANSADSEATFGASTLQANATGFTTASATYDPSVTYIYIAIRRGPMKVPTDATKVFSPVAYSGTGATRTITAGFPVDLAIPKSRGATGNGAEWYSRLIGPNRTMLSSGTFAEFAIANELTSFESNTGVVLGSSSTSGGTNASGFTYVDWNLARAPGFFDEVCYTGTGVIGLQVTHNLTVAPELLIVKRRNSVGEWDVYCSALGATKVLELNSTGASFTADHWNNTTPTSTYFTLYDYGNINASGGTYVAYLFATVAGVSKVGSYTGTGTTKQIDCGFTAGARFVLIKRTDSTGDWYVWDTARGIVSGNDSYLLLNSTAAEVTNTDYIDTYSAGFEISSTAPAAINASGGSYIFLAIA